MWGMEQGSASYWKKLPIWPVPSPLKATQVDSLAERKKRRRIEKILLKQKRKPHEHLYTSILDAWRSEMLFALLGPG